MILQVSMSSIPQLPEYNKLLSELEPFHSQLAAVNVSARRHPVHHTNEVQVRKILRVFICPLDCASPQKHNLFIFRNFFAIECIYLLPSHPGKGVLELREPE